MIAYIDASMKTEQYLFSIDEHVILKYLYYLVYRLCKISRLFYCYQDTKGNHKMVILF